MPIREKAKSFFRRDRSNTKTSTSPSTLSKTSTTTSSTSDSPSTTTNNTRFGKNTRSGILQPPITTSSSSNQWPSHVYRPGEPMPRPKYRATPKKEHTAKLAAFSFADSWRKSSFQSQYSPMGTRAPSRRNSVPSRLPSRRNSVFDAAAAAAAKEDSVLGSDGMGGGAKLARLSTEVERESEEDEEEREKDKENVPEVEGRRGKEDEWGVPRVLSTARDHTPFTEQDLTLALHRSHLVVPTRS